ncbi:DeoR/GlpR family DNA-binding transcription regulator [Eubacteriales bacterium OttesenSCG-928-N13]|nr:DeoR/GlpR family DNA-binding transcription regulator [Eubacteriales bacterium OttesenSCG-928-N13]
MNERQLQLLDMLHQSESELSTLHLSEALGVSEVTVRKDIKLLESHGLLQRSHGSVRPASPDSIAARMGIRYEIKRRIADRAAQLVGHGETLMIESGSSCVLFAQALMQQQKDVTIITNSAFLCQTLAGSAGGNLILLGGDYQADSMVMAGPLTELCAKEFHVQRMFLGIDGYHEGSFSGMNYNRASACRAMAKRADQRIILSDSSKFSRRSVAHCFDASEIDLVITDDGLPLDARDSMEACGTQLIMI